MRTFVMGDPQAPAAKVREVLARHGALDGAGERLAADVHLVSIGDHFDYDVRDPETAGREGLAVLRWLAAHEPAQVTILLGNHDAARVMELAALSDAQFATARSLARDVEGGTTPHHSFAAAFPELPPHGVLGRDYASFCVEQRELVRELLLAGRMQLAATATLQDGRTALVTHAGVTTRELAQLDLPPPSAPPAIAAALQAHLAAAVARVRDAWLRGEPAALSLEPLHTAGAAGAEGGGLLYHRPTNPGDRALDPVRPRRFDPRTLPLGLAQIAGHSGHAKCVHELGAWVAESARARAHGGIRTLRVAGGRVSYELGVAARPAAADEASTADLVLVDGELRRVPAAEFALLPIAAIS